MLYGFDFNFCDLLQATLEIVIDRNIGVSLEAHHKE